MDNPKYHGTRLAHRLGLWLAHVPGGEALRSLTENLVLAIRHRQIRRQISSFVTPWDNQRLTEAEFDQARRICRDIQALILGRERYIEGNRLDPEFCIPGAQWKGNWKKSELYRGTAALLREEYDVINNLRLFSQVFTGYSLVEMKPAHGITPPDHVPPDLAGRLSEASQRIDEWVDHYETLARYLPEFLHISQPNRFGETGWTFAGSIVNHDTYVYLERIALLHASGLLERLGAGERGQTPLILEIGGGFGGLAYHLKRRVPQARYIILDLPESLLFSAIYLSTLFPDTHEQNLIATTPDLITRYLDRPGFTFVPNFFCHHFQDSGIRVNLAINTLSMSEMLASQVTAYCSLIRKCLAPDGVFFEQNQDNSGIGSLNTELYFAGVFPFHRKISLPVHIVNGSPNLWFSREIPADLQPIPLARK